MSLFEILDGYFGTLTFKKAPVHIASAELGVLEAGSYRLRVETDRRIAPFMVNHKSNAAVVRLETGLEHVRMFGRNVPVVESNSQINCGYPNNHMGVLELGHDGCVEFAKIGFVTQNSTAFLLGQFTNWQPQLFRRNGRVICPLYHEEWKQAGQPVWGTLHRVMEGAFQQYVDEFPELPDGYLLPEDTPDASELGEKEGIVTWYEPFHGVGGYGEIMTPRGPAFVLWHDAPRREPCTIRYLAAGERVEIGTLEENSRKDAKCRWIARNVALL